ncbi:extracellular solute-binding protein [Kroppenstedtia guangzhouensis]|jgi:multiple sugar transport system substrate-binding protein|uniref:extracellular solute-binding protein n=1 Tax=Kroppenstedtia guangzhouensis TaxID=1274356 RepID=UPI00166C0D73|nr:extracellular solute-binding protein [Kroppenstedtia guangzhouensis]
MGGIKGRGWLSLVVITALSTVAVGCSLFGDGGTSKDEVITFWHGTTDVEKDALEEIVKRYNEKNPKKKVEAVYIAQQGEGQNEKLLAAIAGGHPPDVAYFDRFEIGSWAAQGSLTEITERVEKAGIDDDSYYDYAIDEARYKGKLYGLPMDSDARLLFYNKDHFKEVGLDPEKPQMFLMSFIDHRDDGGARHLANLQIADRVADTSRI